MQFRSSEAVLAAVRQALLRAWRPALSNSLLAELERLEGGAASAGVLQQAAAEPAAPAGGVASGRGASGVQRARGSGRQLAGSKQSLASRLVRYNAVAALPLGSGQGRSSGPASSGAPPAMQQLYGEPPSKRSCPPALASRPVLYPPRAQVQLAPEPDEAWLASLHLRSQTRPQQQPGQQQQWPHLPQPLQQHQQPEPQQWQPPWAVANLGLENWPHQPEQQQQQQQSWLSDACGVGWGAHAPSLQPHSQASQQPAVGSEEEVRQLIDGWGADGQRQRQPREERQQEGGPLQPGSWNRLPLGSSEEVEALLGSWQPLRAGSWGEPQQGWRADEPDDAWAAGPTSELRETVAGADLLGGTSRGSVCAPLKETQQQQHTAAAALLSREELALVQCAAAAGRHGSLRRPRSAPPHLAQLERAAASRPVWQAGAAAAAAPCEVQQRDEPQILPDGGASRAAEPRPAPSALDCSSGRAEPQPALPRAEPEPVPDFLQPADGGVDQLLAPVWRRPAGSRPAAPAGFNSGSSGSGGVLALETLSAAALGALKPSVPRRQHLEAARVLAQIDRKFVAAVSGSLLLLVDQHAAGGWVGPARLGAGLQQPGRRG